MLPIKKYITHQTEASFPCVCIASDSVYSGWSCSSGKNCCGTPSYHVATPSARAWCVLVQSLYDTIDPQHAILSSTIFFRLLRSFACPHEPGNSRDIELYYILTFCSAVRLILLCYIHTLHYTFNVCACDDQQEVILGEGKTPTAMLPLWKCLPLIICPQIENSMQLFIIHSVRSWL